MKRILLSLVLCLVTVAAVLAQGRTIQGRITDSNGDGIPGVTVLVKGTTNGVTTTSNGSYTLNNVSQGATLIVSSVGYETQEIVVGSQNQIDVSLADDVTELGEVVVTGYGSTLKKEVTGSISSIKSEDLTRIPVSNLSNAISGQASGVFVTSNSGTPGGGITVRIRGATSINASNDPLYVVDGVPVIQGNLVQNGFGGQTQSALNGINPQDIESIEILKDASVTAIYGARAANGVILVTTKRGKKGKPKINGSFFSGFSEASNTYELASAQLWVDSRTAAGGTLPASLTNWDGVTDVDYQDAVFRTANTYDGQISISGGSDALRYFVSGSYRNEEAIFIGGGIERWTGRLNLDYAPIKDKLSFSTRIGVSTELNDRIENDNNIFGIYSIALLSPPTVPIRDPETGEFNDFIFGSNPVREADIAKNDINTIKLIANFNIKYSIIEGLDAIVDFSYDLNEVTEDINNPASTSQGSPTGAGEFRSRRVGTWTFEPRLSYRRTFASDHTISATLGTTFLERKDFGGTVIGNTFAKEELRFLNSAANITAGSSFFTIYSFNSIFARVNYSYKEKYIFNASYRRDGSSRFGSGNRFGNFWSVSAAWNFADENFLANVDWLEVGKLRVGYGVIGNDGIGNFAFVGSFGSGNYLGQSTFTRGNIENPNLKWEETTNLDVGLELSFFNGRVDFSSTYFFKQTEDLLFGRQIPRTTGFQTVTSNVGKTENKGVELELGATILNIGDFQWNVRGNLTVLSNRIIELVEEEPILSGFASAIIEGQPIGAFFGQRWLGVDPATGESVFEDVNGDGAITADDRVVIGDAAPNYFGGINTNLSYKGLSLDVFFQFVGGVDVYNNTRQFLMNPGSNFQNHDDIRFAWQNPGDITFVPRLDGNSFDYNNDNSRWLDNGGFMRLKNVTLAYEFPTTLLSKIKLRSLRVYFTGFNLLTFTKYEGIDPEISVFGTTTTAAGTEFLTVPQPRTYSFGLNLGL